MLPGYQLFAYLLFGVLSLLGLLLLLLRTPYGGGLRRAVDRTLRAISPGGGAAWLDWRLVLLVAGLGYALTVAFDVAIGLYRCHGTGPSDILALAASGRAFWSGGNPFTVPNCGSSIEVPYGLAAVLVDALGSLGGPVGITALWGGIALLLVPLVWTLGGPDRRYVLLFVAVSPLYVPLVATQIDGASNALVPVTVLLALYLARRREPLAAAVGGFLATGRFPALFPLLGAAGRMRRRWAFAGVAIAVFLAVTAATYAVWGRAFFDPVFLSQAGRRSFSLNLYGVLIQQHLLPAGYAVAAGQAALTVLLVVAVFFRSRTALGAAAITLAGVALVTQFLSYSILVSLVPVALLGARPRWWLWAIGIVGTVNYDFAYSYAAVQEGQWLPYDVLGIVLTVLLVGLFWDLWRSELGAATAPGPTPTA